MCTDLGIGVLFDRKLLLRQHIGSIVKKVNRMIGVARRNLHFVGEEVFRLHVYADCVWSLHLKVDNYSLAGKCTEKSHMITIRPYSRSRTAG